MACGQPKYKYNIGKRRKSTDNEFEIKCGYGHFGTIRRNAVVQAKRSPGNTQVPPRQNMPEADTEEHGLTGNTIFPQQLTLAHIPHGKATGYHLKRSLPHNLRLKLNNLLPLPLPLPILIRRSMLNPPNKQQTHLLHPRFLPIPSHSQPQMNRRPTRHHLQR